MQFLFIDLKHAFFRYTLIYEFTNLRQQMITARKTREYLEYLTPGSISISAGVVKNALP